MQQQQICHGVRVGAIIVLHSQPALQVGAEPGVEVLRKAPDGVLLVVVDAADVDVDLVVVAGRVAHEIKHLHAALA